MTVSISYPPINTGKGVPLLNNKPHTFFEDGDQTRDFIHVKDVAKANLSALELNNANYQVIKIGTGKPITSKKPSRNPNKTLQ